MPRYGSVVAAALLMGWGAMACGSNPPPPPPPPPPPAVDSTAIRDSIRADSIARWQAAAQRLCEQARAAMAAGNYEQARSLYNQAKSQYAGSACAQQADAQLAVIADIEVVAQRIHFDFDRANIRDGDAQILQRKADVLKRRTDWTIIIQGNCDERGSIEYNLALGQRRAEAARRYLVGLGLQAARFKTVSFGKERPIAQGSNEQAWAQNRNDGFVIEGMTGS